MTRTLLALAAALALAPLTAQAADMPVKAPAPPPPAPTWTGCYVDGGAGYGMWNQRHTTNTIFGVVPGTTIEQDDGGRGWLGRVGVGCDYQVAPRWIIGALGQYDWMGLKGTNSPLEVIGLGAGGGAPFFPISAQEKERSAWYAGVRLGYVLVPSVLTYVDGGYTSTRFNSQTLTTNLGAPIGFGFNGQTYNGWFLGSGFETSLADWLPGLPQGLFLRSEYRYSGFGQKTINEISQATGLPDGNSENTKLSVQTVTTELVWRFNWH
jgi:outer membrane immunogenic protein